MAATTSSYSLFSIEQIDVHKIPGSNRAWSLPVVGFSPDEEGSLRAGDVGIPDALQ